MGDIIDFAAKKEELSPHVAGEAICNACKYQWAAVAPVGTLWLQCPSCLTHRGLFKFPPAREGLHRTCGCGEQMFYRVKDKGDYCVACGEWLFD